MEQRAPVRHRVLVHTTETTTIVATIAGRGWRISVDLPRLVEQVARVPGVIAVTLGGSRARGTARPDSDWDIGLYYRGSIDTAAVRELGYAGHVTEPGEWGRIVNGGGWVEIDGGKGALPHRDLDVGED